jgi:hypothetical protein
MESGKMRHSVQVLAQWVGRDIATGVPETREADGALDRRQSHLVRLSNVGSRGGVCGFTTRAQLAGSQQKPPCLHLYLGYRFSNNIHLL